MTLATRPDSIPLPEAVGFPPDLLAMRHWVAYDLEEREGGWTKTPIDARPGQRQGRYARSNDPQTWTTFTEAHAFAARRGLGLGFMLAPPLVGIDIDDCRDPETGELSPIAASVLGELDTYAEVSVSGTGVKGIARGTKPGGRCRRKGLQIEIYSERRLFALTGKRLSDAPLAVNDCQEAIDHIYGVAFGQQDDAPSVPWNPAAISDDDDQAVIDWLRSCKSGAKFDRYWAGQDDGDASGADQGMANMIAYRVGPDPARIEALFSASARAGRDKWQKRLDYRERTIRKAIDSCGGRFYEARPQRLHVVPPSPKEVPPQPTGVSVDPALVELLTLPLVELAQRTLDAERRAQRAERLNRAYIHYDRNPKIRAQKQTIRAAMIEYASKVSAGAVDEDGYVPTSLASLADGGGVSKDAAGDHLTAVASWEVGIYKQVREEEYRIPTGNGGEIIQSRPRLYIKVDGDLVDKLEELAAFNPPKAMKSNGEEKDTWGGKRVPCPVCRSQRRLKVVSCADCGHEFGRKIEEPPADTLLPQREEPITAADLRDDEPEEPAADVPSVPPTPIVVPTSQPSYSHGAITYHEVTVEPTEGPDDWDPYECNHLGCVRPVVIGQRYCGEHRSKYVFGAKAIPLARPSATGGIEPPPEDHWQPPTEYDADDLDRVEVAPLRGRIVETPQGPREVFTL